MTPGSSSKRCAGSIGVWYFLCRLIFTFSFSENSLLNLFTYECWWIACSEPSIPKNNLYFSDLYTKYLNFNCYNTVVTLLQGRQRVFHRRGAHWNHEGQAHRLPGSTHIWLLDQQRRSPGAALFHSSGFSGLPQSPIWFFANLGLGSASRRLVASIWIEYGKSICWVDHVLSFLSSVQF